MKVFLRKDIEKVGMAGEVVKVEDGFALQKLLFCIVKSEHKSVRNKPMCRQKQKSCIKKQVSILEISLLSLYITVHIPAGLMKLAEEKHGLKRWTGILIL